MIRGERNGAPKQGGNGKRLYGVSEMPAKFGGSKWFWYSRIWNGELPAVRIGRKYLLDVKDVERLIERHKQVAGN